MELHFWRTEVEVWFVSMSFKSFREFGVSAERLGSFCKRWMARVQRSVCETLFTLFSSSLCQFLFLCTVLLKENGDCVLCQADIPTLVPWVPSYVCSSCDPQPGCSLVAPCVPGVMPYAQHDFSVFGQLLDGCSSSLMPSFSFVYPCWEMFVCACICVRTI